MFAMERPRRKHQLCIWRPEARQGVHWCDLGLWGWSTGRDSQGGSCCFESFLLEHLEEEQTLSSIRLHEGCEVWKPNSHCTSSIKERQMFAKKILTRVKGDVPGSHKANALCCFLFRKMSIGKFNLQVFRFIFSDKDIWNALSTFTFFLHILFCNGDVWWVVYKIFANKYVI